MTKNPGYQNPPHLSLFQQAVMEKQIQEIYQKGRNDVLEEIAREGKVILTKKQVEVVGICITNKMILDLIFKHYPEIAEEISEVLGGIQNHIKKMSNKKRNKMLGLSGKDKFNFHNDNEEKKVKKLSPNEKLDIQFQTSQYLNGIARKVSNKKRDKN